MTKDIFGFSLQKQNGKDDKMKKSKYLSQDIYILTLQTTDWKKKGKSSVSCFDFIQKITGIDLFST